MNDIVIDTNVLVHTNNANNRFNKSAIKALELIKNYDFYVCVDDIFNIDESKNTSVIGHEYIKHVRYGTLAYLFLLDRIINGKIKQICKKEFNNIKQKLNRKIIKNEMSNTHDIVFIIVASGSDNKMLISNDYTDFTDEIRKYVFNEFTVTILDSHQFTLSIKEPPHAR